MNDYIHKFLDFTVGNIFGKDITCREPVDPCDDYQPGSLVEIGRTGIKFFKKFLMPCGLCAAVPVMKPVDPPARECHDCKHEPQKKLIRPTELPFYTVENDSKQTPCASDHSKPSILEENISKIRKSIQIVTSEYDHIKDNISSTVDTALGHSRFVIDYLQEESNLLPRIGAISIGGLAGLIFGLRGGKFKRMLYTTTGALTVGAVCYPKKAEEGFAVTKYYTVIGYNFIRGAKPGELQEGFKLPKMPQLKIPSSFSELVDLTFSIGSSIANIVGLSSSKESTKDENKEEIPKSESNNKED